MGLGDLGNVVLIVFIFMLIHLFLSLSIGIAKIKNNWDEHKCEPGIIPFASIFGHDPVKNLKGCIKSTQMDFMSSFLEPIYASLNYFAENSATFATIFQDVKLFGLDQQMATFDVVSDIKGRMMGIITEINTMYINIIETFSKLGSIITVIFYTIQGSIKIAEASWEEILGTMLVVAGAHRSSDSDSNEDIEEPAQTRKFGRPGQ